MTREELVEAVKNQLDLLCWGARMRDQNIITNTDLAAKEIIVLVGRACADAVWENGRMNPRNIYALTLHEDVGMDELQRLGQEFDNDA